MYTKTCYAVFAYDYEQYVCSICSIGTHKRWKLVHISDENCYTLVLKIGTHKCWKLVHITMYFMAA